MGTVWTTGTWAVNTWAVNTWADAVIPTKTWERIAFLSEVLFELDGNGDIMPKV
jgi:hypothetical protein